jgi:nucleoside-diphosphate-sugar epimerase
MKILVTGGTSLLGRSVAELLRARGDEVSLLQRHAGPNGFAEHLGDIADPAVAIAAAAGKDAVLHVAARVGITGSWEEFRRTNVVGTENLLAAAQAEGVSRFVHISSPSVAHSGRALVGVGAESPDPERARGHYATSKAQAELLASRANSNTFPVVVLRPHLIWGPGDTQLVGRIIARARQGRLATVGTGAALIDTTYISNAADAVVAALDRAPELGGRAFVVTNGQPRPVAELIAKIVTAAGLEPPSLRVPYRAAQLGGKVAERVWDRFERDDDPPMTSFLAEQLATAHWFDQRETRRALQWAPAVSLEEGFERLADWFSHHQDGDPH